MEIIRLNNMGVSLASQGKHDQGRKCFERAVAALHGAVHAVDTGDRGGPLFDSDVQLQFAPLRMNEWCSDNNNGCRDEDNTPCSSDGGSCCNSTPMEGVFEFYDRIFTISFSRLPANESNANVDEAEHSLKCLNHVMTIVMYNLASVCHYLAMKSGRRSHFNKAMNFYDLALSSIENMLAQQLQEGNISNRDFVMPMCGIYNNMGYIHAWTRDIQGMRHCLQWLQRSASVELLNSNLPTDHEDFLFFTMYLTIGILDRSCQTATAA